MDGVLITAAVVLAVIALIEIVTLFFRLPYKGADPPYIMLLPVFKEDNDFSLRLDRLAARSCGRSDVYIVIFSADSEQLELINAYSRDNPDSVIISHEELEKILSKTFAIER